MEIYWLIFLNALVKNPLILFLAGYEFLFAPPLMSPLNSIKRNCYLLVVLYVIRTVFYLLFGYQLLLLPIMLFLLFVFGKAGEHLPGMPEIDSFMTVGTLAVALFTLPVYVNMPHLHFLITMLGIVLIIALFGVMSETFHGKLYWRDNFTLTSGYAQILILVSVMITISGLFRGMIQL